jgi:peptidoglycan/LPS O-acetylase OafA/YrhL
MARSDDAVAVRAPSAAGKLVESRMSGLDGLRAVAVGGVLLYHAGVRWLPGGFLGVDLFFVISGFLITSLLISERQRTGAISLSRFYLRRARRLLPALATMVAATAGFMAVFFRGDLGQARGDIGAAAGYFSNWWYVLHHRSYFVAAGRQPPLQHLWSLAIEEQFYLVWPLLMLLLLFARVRLRWVFAIATIGALASACWMRFLAIRDNVPFDTDSSRLYFGTDTHASALLLGAAGAVVMAGLARRRARAGIEVSPATTLVADLAGLAALAWVGWTMHHQLEASPVLYRSGFFLFAVVAMVVVVTVSLPGSLLGAALDVQPLRWIGTRSYGLYLWHWPVFVYTRPGLDWQLNGWTSIAARLATTGVLTELTFRLIERPIRERGFLAYVRGDRTARWSPASAPRPRRLSAGWRVAGPVLGAVCGTLMVVGATTFVANSASRASRGGHEPTGVAAAPVLSPVADPTFAPTSSAAVPSSPPPSVVVHSPSASTKPTHSAPAQHHTAKPTTSAPAAPPPAGTGSATPPPIPAGPPPPMSAVGDSVMVDGEVALQHDCPGTEVYAVVGWQAKAVFGQIAALRAAGHLGSVVVIGTGTNGLVSPSELDAVLTSLADRAKVILVNNHMDRAWEAPNNALFPQAIKSHPNAVLVDWNAAATAHPEWLTGDGVHLTPAGRAPYAAMIKAAGAC